jgi:hypothetical protein
MKIIELATKLDHAIQGNLSRTPINQLRRRLGVFQHIAFQSEPDIGGTVRQIKTGKYFDWWVNEHNEVTIIPAV